MITPLYRRMTEQPGQPMPAPAPPLTPVVVQPAQPGSVPAGQGNWPFPVDFGGGGSDTITIGSRQVPNPFARLPRWNPEGANALAQQLAAQRILPRDIYRARIEPILAQGLANRRAVAGDVMRLGLGPAFMAEFARRQAFDTAGSLGSAAAEAAVQAQTFNTQAIRSALDAMLGIAGISTTERAQDISQSGDLLAWLSAIYGASQV